MLHRKEMSNPLIFYDERGNQVRILSDPVTVNVEFKLERAYALAIAAKAVRRFCLNDDAKSGNLLNMGYDEASEESDIEITFPKGSVFFGACIYRHFFMYKSLLMDKYRTRLFFLFSIYQNNRIRRKI